MGGCLTRVELDGLSEYAKSIGTRMGDYAMGVQLCLALILSLAFESSVRADSKGTHAPVLHALRGNVISLGNQPASHLRVELARSNGDVIGDQTLGYDGKFAFEELPAGSYFLTLERENAATIGRTIEIKAYPTSKTVFLEIKLGQDSSASIREVVTEFSREDSRRQELTPTKVSKKALKAFTSAVVESERGNRVKAIEHLERAIREQPDYFEAHNNLGVQYQKLRQWPQAIQAFRRAIELRNDSAKPYLNLGITYLELGEFQSALENLESACKLENNSTLVHSTLGQLYFQKQNYVKAQEHLETATRLNPKEARSAFLLLVQLEIIHHDLNRARQYLEVIQHYFPNDPETLKLQETLQ